MVADLAHREFHRKKLARRLLNAGQVEQQEQSFLQRLKQQCGAQFTQKMEGMNNDLTTARDKQAEFEQWLTTQVRSSPVLHMGR
jgi:cullin 1